MGKKSIEFFFSKGLICAMVGASAILLPPRACHADMSINTAECKAAAIKEGYFVDAADELCSGVSSHGQALCLEGTTKHNMFIDSAHNYCSFIETEAQGICMKGAAEANLFEDSARALCGIHVKVAVNQVIPNAYASKIMRYLAGNRYAKVSFNGEEVGELYQTDSGCEILDGAESFQMSSSCSAISDQIEKGTAAFDFDMSNNTATISKANSIR